MSSRTLRKILAPVDFSEGSERALDAAIDFARRFGAEIDVVHVWEPPRFIRPDLMVWMETDTGARSLAEYAQGRARADLDALIEKMGAGGAVPPMRPRVLVGQASSLIAKEAERGGHDLVVMGTHGRGAVSRLVLGSVAERTVRRAPCPVMTVPLGTESEKEASG